MKKIVLNILFALQSIFVFSQASGGLSGKIVDSKTQKPLSNVVVSVQNINLTQVTDIDGKFAFFSVPTGNQIIQIRNSGYLDQLLKIEIEKDKNLDLGVVVLEEDLKEEQQASLVTITDSDLGDENSGSESTAGLLQASRDTFLQAAAFNFGQARFSVRGIDNEYSNVMLNGISMNRLSDGRPQYSNWGGLNDATRNQEFTDGSKPSDYVFSGIAGSQEINTRASSFRQGSRLSFLNTNINYSFRAMATTASGMDNNGWAYAISAGRRWAQDGYFDGTNYAANSIFASVEKRINSNHSLNFTTIYAQNRRGKNSPDTQEVNDLVGVKYNSYWGYQEGEKRNSRVKVVDEPIAILSHYWKINESTQINTNVAYQFGKIGNSRFDFQSADDPSPAYYQKLPSYYLNSFNGNIYTPNEAAAASLKSAFLANPQVDWKNLYQINKDFLSIGSRYVLYEDRTDEKSFSFNSIIASKLADNIFLNGGLTFVDNRSSNFKNLLDLLGGNYFNDLNLFGYGNTQQNDLNNPNRKVNIGEKYGYNYNINSSKMEVFTQFKFTYKKVDFYIAQSFSQSSYQREGLYKNGYYPNNSFEKSEKKEFDNFGFKGGLTYKISGRQFLDFNGLYQSKAPNSKDVFPNARLNNIITPNLTNETIKSFDLSYIIRAPRFKARFSGYINEIKNSTDVAFYFSDNINGANNNSSAFVSELITGQNKRNRGIEVGLEYQITSTIKATAVAAYGEYLYTNKPKLTTTNDKDGFAVDRGEVNQIGYKVAGLPQQAYSLGLEYRDPKFWWIGANINYLSDNYVDFAPLLRTANFKTSSDSGIPYNQDLADKYLIQEKFNPFYLLNLVGGKTWRINTHTLGLFANINNVLDAKYKTGGFEQARNATFSEVYKDSQGAYKSFGSKYFYGYGRTYTFNLYFTF